VIGTVLGGGTGAPITNFVGGDGGAAAMEPDGIPAIRQKYIIARKTFNPSITPTPLKYRYIDFVPVVMSDYFSSFCPSKEGYRALDAIIIAKLMPQ
jgi:hypothetical protein